jgi:hypothetical protein
MLDRNNKTQALAMILLTLLVAVPLLTRMTANYPSNHGNATTLSEQPRAQKDGEEIPPYTLNWTYNTYTTMESSPAIADVNHDGKLEVIVSYGNYLDVLNGTSAESLQYYNLGGEDPFYESPVVADINGTGTLQMIVVSNGNLFCLNWTGPPWFNDYYGAFTGSPAIGDVDGDGKLEIVIGSGASYGYVFSINGTTGDQEWQYPDEGTMYASPTLADINSDGKLEVIVLRTNSTGAFVQCLNGTADVYGYVHPLWSCNVTGSTIMDEYSTPAVADIDKDGHMEVVVGAMDGKVHCISYNGVSKWNYTTGAEIYSSPTIADIDGDGKLETLVGSYDENIYCLSSTGGLRWSSATGGYVTSSPAVADIDGDKQLEVLVGTESGSISCFNRTGVKEWSYETGGVIRSSPAIADIDGDGKLEVVICQYEGYVYCLRVTSAPIAIDAFPWPSIGYREDVRHTGCITDSDQDGLTDNYEVTAGTNPNSPDTDGDTATDYQEFLASTNPFADTVPPATITNLAVTTSTTASITLTWTAPGNNSMSGNATGYLVKYSTSGGITDANWASATNFTESQSWVPVKNGTAETHVVTGLSPNTQYWFAIKAYDEVPNYSSVSNSPRLTTLTTGWQSNPPINLIPGPGNNATTPAGTFQQYGFTMVTNNATDVTVISASSNPPGTGAPPSGEISFLYLDIKGTQISGTSGLAIYIYYNRTLVPSGIDETSMQIHRWNATTSRWVAIPSTVTIIDLTHGVITAHLDHFSYFAVLGTPSSGGNTSTLLIVAGVGGASIIVVVLAILVLRKRRVAAKVVKVRRTRRASR